MSSVLLPVSIGEALDKLTILDIKVKRISNPEKNKECMKEYDALNNALQEYVQALRYWYKTLYWVNDEIWRLQDILRANNTDNNELANHVLNLNDIRFRIKNNINLQIQSKFKEQKGYNEKNAILTLPLTMQSYIKYLGYIYSIALSYDNLYIVCDTNDPYMLHETLRSHPFLKYIVHNELELQDQHALQALDDNSSWKNMYFEKVYRFSDISSIETTCGISHEMASAFSPTKGLFVTHQGLGDQLALFPAACELAKQVDEIYIVCAKSNIKNLAKLYSRQPKARLLAMQTNHHSELFDNWRNKQSSIQFLSSFEKHFMSGTYKHPGRRIYDVPRILYLDLGLSISLMQSDTLLPKTPESVELYNRIKDKEYIFVHQTSSTITKSIVTWDIQAVLTIDPNNNLYQQGDAFYDVAQEFINKPVVDYTDIIRNAREVHVIDSCFCCLCLLLDLSRVSTKKIYSRDTGEEMKILWM